MHTDRRRFLQVAAVGMAGACADGHRTAKSSRPLRTFPAEIPARTLSGVTTSVAGAEIRELAASLRGELLVSGDYGYDGARSLWNGMHERMPAVIVRAANAADVSTAVTFAREQGLLLAVKGGGHSWPGRSVADGALLLDLHALRRVSIDVSGRRAKVDGGALLYDLDHAAQRFGFATTSGIVSHTGVGGLTLGGGFGRLNRKFGLTIDNLLSATLVTADGRVRQINSEEEPDLFWAIRGGGGNFGVVTQFEYRLHDIGRHMLGGVIVWPIAAARKVLAYYAEHAERLPDDVYIAPSLTTGPDGKAVVTVDVCCCGDPTSAEKSLAGLRKVARPTLDSVAMQPYVALQSRMDAVAPPGIRSYTKSGMLRALDPGLIDDLLARYQPGMGVTIGTFATGGRTARVAEQATAWPHRNARAIMYAASFWPEPSDDVARIASVRRHYAIIEPYVGAYYSNIQAEDVPVASNYGPVYPRLRSVKARYDPTNLFRLNSNVAPRMS